MLTKSKDNKFGRLVKYKIRWSIELLGSVKSELIYESWYQNCGCVWCCCCGSWFGVFWPLVSCCYGLFRYNEVFHFTMEKKNLVFIKCENKTINSSHFSIRCAKLKLDQPLYESYDQPKFTKTCPAHEPNRSSGERCNQTLQWMRQRSDTAWVGRFLVWLVNLFGEIAHGCFHKFHFLRHF